MNAIRSSVELRIFRIQMPALGRKLQIQTISVPARAPQA